MSSVPVSGHLPATACSNEFLLVQPRTPALLCNVRGYRFSIGKETVTLPSLITSHFSGQPDLKQFPLALSRPVTASLESAVRGWRWTRGSLARWMSVSPPRWALTDSGAAKEIAPSFSLLLCAIHWQVAFKKKLLQSHMVHTQRTSQSNNRKMRINLPGYLAQRMYLYAKQHWSIIYMLSWGLSFLEKSGLLPVVLGSWWFE